MKVDLHVHSKYSTRPSYWVLQKMGAHECYTEPRELYRLAKERGMSLVTITDHNTIAGCLDIAHLPDTFISEEVTTYFPEDRCKIHVLVYNITEQMHGDIQRFRDNIFDLVQYLNESKIIHSVAHPLWSINNRLTSDHFEQLLLLFKNFELNGSRDEQLNHWLKSILASLTPRDLEALAAKYHFPSPLVEPWRKNLTGGSDDHSSMQIARMYTQVKGAVSPADFLARLDRRETSICGYGSTPLTLGHNIYGITYQFYKEKYRNCNQHNYRLVFDFFESFFNGSPEPKGFSHKLRIFSKVKKYIRSSLDEESLIGLFKKEAATLISDKITCCDEDEWFTILNRFSTKVLKHFQKKFQEALIQANLIDLIESLASSFFAYFGMIPYIAGFASFAADKRLGNQLTERFLVSSQQQSLVSDHGFCPKLS